jgi:hypothetical protein
MQELNHRPVDGIVEAKKLPFKDAEKEKILLSAVPNPLYFVQTYRLTDIYPIHRIQDACYTNSNTSDPPYTTIHTLYTMRIGILLLMTQKRLLPCNSYCIWDTRLLQHILCLRHRHPGINTTP